MFAERRFPASRLSWERGRWASAVFSIQGAGFSTTREAEY